jgi:hypothetical protein
MGRDFLWHVDVVDVVDGDARAGTTNIKKLDMD